MKARTIEAAACPELSEARYRLAHTDRDFTTWIDTFGVGRAAWRGTPDALAWIRGALAPYIKHELRAASKAGRAEETYGNCAADAFVAMARAASGEQPHQTSKQVMLRARVDYSALVTGKLQPGEVCEIEGVGPVPLSVMDRLIDEHPLVDAVLTQGRDVTRIAHLGRSGDTYLKAALEWRDHQCVVVGCDRSDYLDSHHLHDVAHGGRSSLDGEVRLCGYHHGLITHKHYQLTGNHHDGHELHAPWCEPDEASGPQSQDTGRAPPDTG